MGVAIIVIYSAALALIFVYCLVQFHLARQYMLFRKKHEQLTPPSPDLLPFVTIQLPIYNELYVSERLLESVAKIDYPLDRFEVQVLDDSTDETVEVVAAKCAELEKQGISITHVRRVDRTGYKAGALQEGMAAAKGELIAIFDADFTPKTSFLKKTIPWFSDPKIGVVQTRWEHINKNYSLLTRMQAFALDMHFTVEQLGRYAAGYFINFNGTAGIWRKSCIMDAGGWKADTLTEDMDLSYRAQLNGWKFIYLENVVSPAELPTEMSAVKSQQFRWNKGGAETARKLAWRVLNSPLKFRVKFHAVAHLLNTSNYLWIFLTAMLSIPLLYVKNELIDIAYFKYASVFLFGSVAIAYAYYVSTVFSSTDKGSAWRNYALRLPIFLAITMGLSLHNAWAVFQGWIGKKSAFIRTPKFNIIGLSDRWTNKKYTSGKINFLTWLEGVLCLYFIWGAVLGIQYADYGLLPFHLMAAFGFGMIFFYSVRHAFIIPTGK